MIKKWIKNYRKFVLISTPIAVFAVTALIWTFAVKPLVISIIRNQLPNINSSQNVVTLQVGDIYLSLLRLQAAATDITVRFNDDALGIEPVRVKSVTAQLDIFNLIIGRINLSKIIIERADVVARIKTDSKKTELPKIPVAEIFKILNNVPVDHIILLNSSAQLTEPQMNLKSDLSFERLIFSNYKSEASLKIENLTSVLTKDNSKSVTVNLHLDATALTDNLKVNRLSVTALNSEVQLDAEFPNYSELLRRPEGRMDLESRIDLQDVRNIALVFFPQKNRIPSISGLISTDGHVEFKNLDDISGNINLKTSQVVLDHFKLGQADLKTTISRNQINIDEINLQHPAGQAQLKNIKFEQKSPFHFSTRLEADGFDLYKLFVSLGLSEIPAGLKASGQATCEGLLEPSLLVSCSVNTGVKDVWVKSSNKEEFYIVKLKQGHVAGEVKINQNAVTYHANIDLGTSSNGISTGEVNFKEGFKIQYESNNLNFSDVETLAGLDFKGHLKIIGSTTGDSNHGLINASISASDAEIENFRLGSFSTTLGYKAAQLNFSNIIGVIGKSDITGQLNFDFNQSKMTGAIVSENLYGEDLLNILNKKFNLPFELYGQGRAAAKIDGPFDFWKMSYVFNSELKQGSIAGERFEKLVAEITANGKQVDFKNVRLKKLKTNLVLDGQINTIEKDPVFDLKLRANPLQLEESDHIIRYAPSIAGTGYSDGSITGPLSHPSLVSNITLKQVTYDKIEYPNSQGQLKINKDHFAFNGQFFGRQIQTDILWPWNANDAFHTRVLVHELNPLFLLPLVTLPQPGSDFYSRLNAQIDLSSSTRSFDKADGFIKINDFLLQRGNQSLKSVRPGTLFFKSGLRQMDDFELTGEDSFLKLRMDKTSSDRVRLNIEGDLQLRMFHFLVPFAQTLSGNLVVNSQVLFKENTFELVGEGEITDGLVNLKGFPQPIENINAPIEFSKSKIILSDITGQLGQSDVTGLGHIEILGAKNIAVNLRAIADNVQLNFPNKVLTEGKASVLFTGNWLPYNLKIDYKVSQGLVENDFEPDPKQSLTLKASNFLPPQQAQMLSASLALDVNVDLSNGILIKNKLLEGEAKGHIQVQGSPEQPILIGKVDITRGSKLIFKDKPFEIQNAVIQFQGTKEINPDVYITANSRVAEYDINLLVQGLAKNLNITPTSQPPLATNEIFTLLALGVTNQANQNLSSDTQQRQTGLEVLAAISNQSQLNKKIQEKLGLTVQLAPSVDSTKNIAVPKVVVSKKITKKINASYSKPFTGNDQNQEVKLQYLYNNNVSLQLNYQNKDTAQQEQITNSNNTNKSTWGLDLEYRDEFK